MKTSLQISTGLALLLLLLLAGCGRPPEPAPRAGHTYTVRGQVAQLPDPANPGSGLSIQHEAIDRFVDREGKTVGMDSMTMPFPVAPQVSLQGIAPGEAVEFDLNVDWQADPAVEITRIRKLPAGTRLDFRAAKPEQTH